MEKIEKFFREKFKEEIFLISWNDIRNRLRITTFRKLGQDAYLTVKLFVEKWIAKM